MTAGQPRLMTATLPGIFATYRRAPGSKVWHIADSQLDGPPLPQKIPLGRLHEILKTAKCGAPRWCPLENLAAAVESIRHQTLVATTIKAELAKRRTEKARERRAVVDAVATLRRHLLSEIDRWQQRAEAELDEAERPEGALRGQSGESYVVREARALLAKLDRVPGLEPLEELEEPWHEAAVQLACFFVAAFGNSKKTTSWYWKGPAIGFVQAALKAIGCGDREPDAICRVIRRAFIQEEARFTADYC